MVLVINGSTHSVTATVAFGESPVGHDGRGLLNAMNTVGKPTECRRR